MKLWIEVFCFAWLKTVSDNFFEPMTTTHRDRWRTQTMYITIKLSLSHTIRPTHYFFILFVFSSKTLIYRPYPIICGSTAAPRSARQQGDIAQSWFWNIWGRARFGAGRVLGQGAFRGRVLCRQRPSHHGRGLHKHRNPLHLRGGHGQEEYAAAVQSWSPA